MPGSRRQRGTPGSCACASGDGGRAPPQLLRQATRGGLRVAGIADGAGHGDARRASREHRRDGVVNGFFEPFVKELPMEYAVELNRLLALSMEGSVG